MQQEHYQQLQQFKSNIKKTKGHRCHSVVNSIGLPEAFRELKKRELINCSDKEFKSIVRAVNEELTNDLLLGLDIKLPYSLGVIETRKYDAKVSLKGCKIVTNKPIDWNETLNLWFEDEEAKKNKVLVRVDKKQIVKIRYNKATAKYKNKTFFKFNPCRSLKLKLKDAIENNKFDTFKI